MAPIVDVRDLVVVRGRTHAVDGVSMSLDTGSVNGLLGPSGSGKSTLMRAIIGSQVITRGSVMVDGHPANSPEARSRIGYMAQTPALYSDLTVEENLRYFASVLGLPRARVSQVIADMDLDSRRQALVRTLSGGEASRVSLGAAMLSDPPILVLDEPTVGLDPILRRDLWQQFRRCAEQGTALLVSSHVMDEAKSCDRLLLLRDGCLLFDGSQEALAATTGTGRIEDAFIALAGGESA